MTGLGELTGRLRQRLEANNSFAVYHKPKADLIRTWFPDEVELTLKEGTSGSGFIFSPFDSKIPSVLFPLQTSEILETKWNEAKLHMGNRAGNETKIDLAGFSETPSNSDKLRHLDLVQRAIAFIRSGKASKIVISRKEEIELPDADPIGLFLELLYKYPKAFVYLWYHPEIGMWLGASPETLLSVKNNTFRTMSLAGTQVYQEGVTTWGEKELEEQLLVTQLIEEILKGQLTYVGSPYTQRAGHLVHLRTDIEGTIAPGAHPRIVVDKLHPTAAVCGMPRDRAQDFILKNEGYSREYYTGYLGELLGPDQKDSDLFVNLRCMKLLPSEKKAWIYVGGGITGGSHAEKEWEETVVKSQTMKRVFS